MSVTNSYQITNLTTERFRFIVGRKIIIINPEERRTVNINKNPEYKVLINEIPYTHMGLITIKEILEKEVNEK